MLLTEKLAAFLPASFKNFFVQRRNELDKLIERSIDIFEIENQQFLIGIEQCQNPESPLQGSIIHFSSNAAAYHAASGRNADGSINFKISAVTEKLRQLLTDEINQVREFAVILTLLAKGQNISFEQLVLNLAENAHNLKVIPTLLVGAMNILDFPPEFNHCIRWIESNMGQWRLRAYHQIDLPIFKLLDCHRYGRQRYSLSGTESIKRGMVFDEAIWVADDMCNQQIEMLSVELDISINDAAVKFVSSMVDQYNAYLKHQIFKVHIRQLRFVDNVKTWTALDSSAYCYGYDMALKQKEVSMRKLWHIKFN